LLGRVIERLRPPGVVSRLPVGLRLGLVLLLLVRLLLRVVLLLVKRLLLIRDIPLRLDLLIAQCLLLLLLRLRNGNLLARGETAAAAASEAHDCPLSRVRSQA
jgi:hypothetical protein